jgi:two-component system, LytTR family, response regulator
MQKDVLSHNKIIRREIMKLNAIIIDDESKARNELRSLIVDLCPDVTILDEAENVKDAVKLIHKHKPDIVFSDIDMPGLTGLQLLDFFNEEELTFELIYVTAYSEYAVNAFQLSAIDYLLKPAQSNLLQKAVEKVQLKQNYKGTERLAVLKENLSNDFSRIALTLADGVQFVEINDILYLKAENVYTEVYMIDGSKILVSKPIKIFEKMLETNPFFFRSHRSYLINIRHIKQYIKTDGGVAIMDNDTEVPIARDRKDEFIKSWAQAKV